MRRIACLCLLMVAVTSGSGKPALADLCGELQSRLSALDAADRDQWEGSAVTDDPYALERARIAVLDDLARNQCRRPVATRDGRPSRFLAMLFPGKRRLQDHGAGDRRAPYGLDLSFGTYRTLCVRHCDGYYFPISFSASGAEITRDENACRALCPGQSVALYVQPGGEGSPMVSLADEPYTALPAAFRYRREYDPTCACGEIDASTIAALRIFAAPVSGTGAGPYTDVARPPVTTRGPAIPSPPRRVTAEDPETLARRAGGVPSASAARGPLDRAVYRPGPDGKVVRLVGPALPLYIK